MPAAPNSPSASAFSVATSLALPPPPPAQPRAALLRRWIGSLPRSVYALVFLSAVQLALLLSAAAFMLADARTSSSSTRRSARQ